jgi:hypothetical protein
MMEVFDVAQKPTLALGLSLLGCFTLYLLFSKTQRKALLHRLSFSRGRERVSDTPPPSVSPQSAGEKKAFGEGAVYADTFPPSRRFALGQIQSSLSEKTGLAAEELAKSPATSRNSCTPHDRPWDECKQPCYTATEFSVDEIKALGDFPDYATLSGVPLPAPYTNFDINTALPRPYRPFRWAYHQTMCK